MSAEKHVFALFVPQLSLLINDNIINEKIMNKHEALTITDQVLCHRIMHVLRLPVGENIIFFDRSVRVHGQLRMLSKREIVCAIIDMHYNTALTPHITCVLPLLKRDDFETALTILGSLGVNSIQLLITDKTMRSWGAKEQDRAERVIIAAAEQSKCFAMPILQPPMILRELCNMYAQNSATKIYFDVDGKSLFDTMTKTADAHVTEYICMVGPEGDLTLSEKRALQDAHFVFCKLTPTVLRSVYAVCLGVGAFRSL